MENGRGRGKEESKRRKTMEGMKSKKESGAEGRKRRKLEANAAEKCSKFFRSYFKEAGASTSGSSTCRMSDASQPATLDCDGGSNCSVSQEEVNSVKCNEVKDSAEEPGRGGSGDVERIDESESSELEPTTVIPEVIEQHDIGLLKFDTNTGKTLLSDSLRTEIIRLGAKYFQNSEGPFAPTNNRCMNKNWFKRKLADGRGEEVIRSWLIYSPSKKSAFCFCCLLFSASSHQSALEQETGFNNWKAPERMGVHENAKIHRASFTKWKEVERNLVENRGVIDVKLQAQIAREKEKWREILRRVLYCIKFLATQNLPLRGHRESLQTTDDSNVGNFLALLKLLSVFDPVMKEHLVQAEKQPGSTSYLSPSVQNEFIHLMASSVRLRLLKSIRKAKYYGLMFDSTPDQAHREQMSEVVRYVEVNFETKTVRVRESFLGFIEIKQKDAKSLVDVIMKQLEADEMDIGDCRSQCYDNAAVMAGHKSGVSQRIKEKNNLAMFVNCDNHSLNLVGVHAAKQDALMVTFFGTIEALYVFFARSTQRWEKLKTAVPVVLKSESKTRWSARVEAVRPVSKYIEKILPVLQAMISDKNENSETRSEAEQLSKSLLNYRFLTLLGFCNGALISIDRVQKRLQDPTMNFHDAALDLKGLRDHFYAEREALVNESLDTGFALCQKFNIEIEKRRRRKKMMPGERSRDAGLTARQEMEKVMKESLDRLHIEMDERFALLQDADSKFGFLLDVNTLCYGVENINLKNMCTSLGESYSCDINGEQLYEEILDCRMLLLTRTVKISRPEGLLNFIVQYGDEGVFPNLRIATQIMLTISISIASCERSFSKLNLILSYLRASMGQDRLCDLALLSVEREEVERTNFEDIIDKFAAVKARKIVM